MSAPKCIHYYVRSILSGMFIKWKEKTPPPNDFLLLCSLYYFIFWPFPFERKAKPCCKQTFLSRLLLTQLDDKKMTSGAMIHPKITFQACFFYMVSKAILLYTKISTFWFWWLQIKFRSTRVSVISLKVIENIEFINNLLKNVEF